jgi:tRNA (cytidine32/guanosine34-2'-O)-methyltransferase
MNDEVKRAVPFLACGDLRDGDSDANYDLDPEEYVHREVVQPPTAPPYKTALEIARGGGHQRQEAGDAVENPVDPATVV